MIILSYLQSLSTPWGETSRFSKHRSIPIFVIRAVKYHLLALSHRSRVVGSASGPRSHGSIRPIQKRDYDPELALEGESIR